MTDLAERLQRRAQGGGPPMLPILMDRPADPRFGLASSLTDPDHEGDEEFFEAPGMSATMPPSDPATVPAATVLREHRVENRVEHRVERSVERNVERIIERSNEPRALAPAVSAPAMGPPSAPVRSSTMSVTPAASVAVTPIAATLASTPTEPIITASRPPDDQPVPKGIQQYTPAAPRRRIVRPVEAPRHAREPSSEPLPRVEIAPPVLGAVEPLARVPSPPAPERISRLEPRPREPRPTVDVAPEPPSPRVVIGNLHIEVVRAPAPPTPRREPPRRESPRTASRAATTSTRTRRRTVFGLGQL